VRIPDKDRCQEDLRFGELEETTRTSSYYVDEDYPARHETQLPAAIVST